MSVILLIILIWLSVADCPTALNHRHDRLKDVEVIIAGWNGCTVTGTINGLVVPLYMDVPSCLLHGKVPGKFRARYCQTCGAILEITDGPVISTPMPPACPTPTPSPAPTPTPAPGTITVSGKTFSAVDGTPFPYVFVVLSDANDVEITRMQEQDDASYRFENRPPGSYQVHVEQGGYNTSPYKILLNNIGTSTGGLTILNFTIGPDAWFPRGPTVCFPVACSSPTPTPTPAPPTPTPTPTPSPSPSPTPVPTPTCTISAPDSIALTRNTAMDITVTTSTSPHTVKVIGSDGQVTVSPLFKTGTSPFVFRVSVKRQGRKITFTSPCGQRTVKVEVR